MTYQIRKSDTQPLYYLIKIDDEHNEQFVAESETLAELKKHKSIAGKKIDVINEQDTRGIHQEDKE